MTIWIPNIQESTLPKYLALADAIDTAVEKGELRPGQKLPTHRDLADQLGITVGTVTRGYSEARKRGKVSGTVGRGTYISMDVKIETSMMSTKKKKDVIEMGLITPLYSFDPILSDELSRLSKQVDIQDALHYSDPVGQKVDREAATIWLKEYGLDTSADDVIITAGAQHGLNCVLSGIFSPGDKIAVEQVTYPGFKTLASMLGITLVPVDIDEEGMQPDILDTVCRRDNIKAIFVMPGQQNPTTGRMSRQRRVEIVQIATKHSLYIIEDCAYDLSSREREQPLSAIAPERTFLIAGVSKYFGAGLRTAYLVAHHRFHAKIRQAILNTIWMASPITVRLTSMLINHGTAQQVLREKFVEAQKRNLLAQTILHGLNLRAQADGFFLWLSLPEPWSGTHLELAAAEQNVSVFCGDKFAVGAGTVPQGVRISLSGPETIEELRVGLNTIKDILNSPPNLSALM